MRRVLRTADGRVREMGPNERHAIKPGEKIYMFAHDRGYRPRRCSNCGQYAIGEST